MKIRDTFLKPLKEIPEKLLSNTEAAIKKGIKLPNYRTRLVALSIAMVLLTQVAFIINAGINTGNAALEIKDSTRKEVFYSLYNSFTSMFDSVDRIITTLSDTNFSDYVRSYVNLQTPDKAEEELAKLNRQIDSLNISSKLVEKIYLLGGNSFQKNYARSMNGEKVDESQIPWVEDLIAAEIMYPFIDNSGVPVFFSKDQFRSQLENAVNKADPQVCRRVESFLGNLDGKLIMCRYYTDRVKTDFSIVVVMNPGFLASQKRNSGYLTLLDQHNQLIYSNLPVNILDSDKVRSVLDSRSEGEWNYRDADVSYRCSYKKLSPFSLKFIYAVEAGKMTGDERKALFYYLMLVLACTCFLAFLPSYFISAYVTMPLNQLSKAINQQKRTIPFRKISIDAFSDYPFRNLPFNRKIVYYFTLSVLIPVLISGLVYSNWLYNYTKNMLRDSVISVSNETGMNISCKLNTYMDLMNQLTASGIFGGFLNRAIPLTESDKKQINTILLNHISSLGDISYIALLDSYGTSRYQSIYPDNPERFKVTVTTIASEYQSPEAGLFWLPQVDNVFNEPSLVLVKKINVETDNKNETKTVGYLQMFLKDSVFQTIMLNQKLDFAILDHQDRLVYQSNKMADYSEAIALLKNDYKTSGGTGFVKEIPSLRQLAGVAAIDVPDWKIFIFQSLDNAFAKSRELYMRNLSVVFIILLFTFLLSWWLAKLIVKPIHHLESEMKLNYDGNIGICMKYGGSDEIGQLVKTYNEMIEQINRLIEENVSSKVREQELITLKTIAELNMLQQQINPHFLYNTLEAIKNMTLHNKGESAGKMVSALAQIFRFSVNTADREVTLEKEIEYVQNYIMIQKMRFGDKFSVNWDLDEEAMPCKVLKLILQPIVENSIIHGLSEYVSGGIIDISVKKVNGAILLKVADNGLGMRPAELKALMESLEYRRFDITERQSGQVKYESGRVGLKNVYDRLEMFYHGKSAMHLESRFMEGTTVNITIPVQADLTEV